MAGLPGTTLADYVAYPWITALPGSRIRGELEMSLRQAGLPIPDMIGVLSLEFGREMLLDGQYLWMLPGSVAAVQQARGELAVLPARPALRKSPLAAIWRRDRPSTRQARAFAAQLELAIQADSIALAA
nr:LysR substrate-binding domain-containing protein [Achromobacter agilis]